MGHIVHLFLTDTSGNDFSCTYCTIPWFVSDSQGINQTQMYQKIYHHLSPKFVHWGSSPFPLMDLKKVFDKSC